MDKNKLWTVGGLVAVGVIIAIVIWNLIFQVITLVKNFWQKGGKEVENVEIVELIKVTFKRGKGTEDDPIRVVSQYWDKENVLIFEKD